MKKSVMYLSTMFLLATISIFFFHGCADRDNPLNSLNDNENKKVVINVTAIDSCNITFKINNETKAHDFSILSEQLKKMDLNGKEIEINFVEQASGLQKTTGDIKGQIGSYYFRLSYEDGFIGCFKRNVKHVGAMMSKVGVQKPLVDIHIASWLDGKKVCAGIYNSGSKAPFCWTKCSPTYRDMIKYTASALVAAGIAASTAAMIAEVITPAAIVLLPFGI